jgi:hypothetical protein
VLHMRRSGLAAIIDELEERGLVTRQDSLDRSILVRKKNPGARQQLGTICVPLLLISTRRSQPN